MTKRWKVRVDVIDTREIEVEAEDELRARCAAEAAMREEGSEAFLGLGRVYFAGPGSAVEAKR